MLTRQQIQSNINALEQQGAKPAEIQEWLDSLKNNPVAQVKTPTKKSGFLSNVGQALKQRSENLNPILDRYSSKKQGLLSSTLQFAGQAAGGVGDIIGQGISSLAKTLTPKPIEKKVKSTITDIINSPKGQEALGVLEQGIDKYQSWKIKNPEFAANLEAVVNIAELTPLGRAKKATGFLEKSGQSLISAGEESIQKNTDDFLRTLVRKEQTKSVREAQVARTSEKGRGLFKKSIIEPDRQELLAEDAVKTIPGLSNKNTFQQNYNIIKSSETQAARQLEQDLASNNFIISKKEIKSKLLNAKNRLSESPTITGDAEKTVEKLLTKVNQIIDENSGDAIGLLNVRKQYDQWVKTQKSKVFDAKTDNAFTIANREIRNSLNDLLDEKAINVDVKNSLRKQSGLYAAMENIAPKAAKEADSVIGRILDKTSKIVGTKNKFVQGVAAAVGIGGLGAAATFAPAAAISGIGGYLLYKGGKLVLSPKAKIALGNLLKTMQKIQGTKKPQAAIIIESIQQLLDDYKEE